MPLDEREHYQLQPWNLPTEVQKDAAAIWVNYPHNPTGATVDDHYWTKLITWAHDLDCVILSDDCYVDIYDPKLDLPANQDRRPKTPLQFSSDRVLAFFSLSKRSGMTGFRCGMIAGDPHILRPHLRARANFGLGVPQFIQDAACVAWTNEGHVAQRRQIFAKRMQIAGDTLRSLGMLAEVPEATFYLWAKLPPGYSGTDVAFCRSLAERGVIATPASWLGEASSGAVRFAMVPDEADTIAAMDIIKSFIHSA